MWTTTAPNSFPSPGPGWQPQPVPEGFDYDFWLGPAPEAPYHIERCFTASGHTLWVLQTADSQFRCGISAAFLNGP